MDLTATIQHGFSEPTTQESELTAPDRSERIAALFEQHHPRLYRLGLRMSGRPEEAEDLVQDTFVRAARARQAIPETESVSEAWLVRILVNLCRDRYRRREVRERLAFRLDDPADSSERSESSAVARVTLERALAELAPRRRAILVLHELEGQPIARIAEQLGVAAVTVRWHLAAAKKQLKRRLGAEDTP